MQCERKKNHVKSRDNSGDEREVNIMKNKKPTLAFGKKVMRVAPLGKASPLPDLAGEHILQNDLEFRLGEEEEIYEGYGKCENAYPYRQYNAYTRDLRETEIVIAVLENDYLKAVFLPEFGGRLWELWDKETGENLLYTNDVIRYSNLAVRNAWFSGGVEWNMGVIGHTPLTTEQLYVAQLEDEAGNPVLRMYEYERIRGAVYQMDFWLEEESRYLYGRMRIVNESREVIPMYWWSNIAVPEYENGHIIVPADEAFTYADGAVFKVDIPMVGGVDVTAYGNIPQSVDYFFDIPQEAPKYIANINQEGYGLLQASTKRLRSRKLFSWGHCQGSAHWQHFLTENQGPYVEIQAGLGKTQYGCLPMAPHTAWEWVEQYGPVHVNPKILQEDHQKRVSYMTKKILAEHVEEQLEKKKNDTKKLAKTKARLLMEGSGFGAIRPEIRGTEHLEFIIHEESLLRWQHFIKTGKLEKKKALDEPGDFCVTKENLYLLENAVNNSEAENWYAWYLLGIGYFLKKEFEKAGTAFISSWELEENPWAAHGAAAVYICEKEFSEASLWAGRGIAMKKDQLSYVKEGFKQLQTCGAYEKICSIYKELPVSVQKDGRIRLYYIRALHELGENQEACMLLEENGGLVVADIREGENTLACLWEELNEATTGQKDHIPYRYDFKAC